MDDMTTELRDRTPADAEEPTPPTAPPARQRLLELLAFAGIALVVAAALVIVGQLWDQFTLTLRMSLLGGGAVALAIIAAVVATRPAGVAALRAHEVVDSDNPARRPLVAVLVALVAVLTTATIMQLPLEAASINDSFGNAGPPEPYWTATIAMGVGLVIALAGAYVAPGVVSTLAVWGFTVGTLSTAMNRILWSANPDQSMFRTSMAQCIVMSVVGLLGALVASRWLRPAVLAIALGVGTWFFTALSAATEGEVDPEAQLPAAVVTQAEQTGLVGRVSLAVLLVLGTVLYLRGSEWPWPSGAIASMVALTILLTSHTLGVAASLLITGILLVAVSGGLGLVQRGRHRRAATG